MQSISNLTVFNGVIPNKATQTDTEFANNIFGFLNYSGVPFVTDVNTIVSQLNILSDQINTAATQTATNAQNAVNATATLTAGSIDDVVILGTKAYSNQKVNALFSTYENKKGSNLPSAATTTIGTAGLGDMIHITGTTTITSFGNALVAGVRRTLIFDGALTLTNGANIVCPGVTDIVTTAGTVVEVVADTTTTWKVLCISHPSLSYAKMGYLSTITSDLQAQLTAKAPLASPAFTGSPTAPTATAGTNNTQIATTAYVKAEIPNSLNASGTAPIYACRAWVNFNGNVISIRASGNVSSITDFGVGYYGVNFTTAMPDANYSYSGSAKSVNADLRIATIGENINQTRTTSTLTIRAGVPGSSGYDGWLMDSAEVNVNVFR